MKTLRNIHVFRCTLMSSWLLCSDECILSCLPSVNIYNCVHPNAQNIVNWNIAMSEIFFNNCGLCTA